MFRFLTSVTLLYLCFSGNANSQVLKNDIPPVRLNAPQHKTPAAPKPVPKKDEKPATAGKPAVAPKPQTTPKAVAPKQKTVKKAATQTPRKQARVPVGKKAPKKTAAKEKVIEKPMNANTQSVELSAPIRNDEVRTGSVTLTPPNNSKHADAEMESAYQPEEKDYHNIDGCDCMKYTRGRRPWKFRNRRKYEYKYYIRRMETNHGRHH